MRLAELPAPFIPTGQQARTAYVVEWAAAADIGDLITYERFAALMEVQQRSAVQGAVHRALPILERDYSRTLETIKGVGYRVADARGHLRLGGVHRRKASRSLRRGQSKVESVDLRQIRDDPELVRRLEAERVAIDDVIEANRRADDKLRRMNRLRGGE